MGVELFTLYGRLEADTKQFQDALRGAESRLDETGKRVSQTEQRSKSLGITTAASARSYERLNERLGQAQARLAATATAFSKGEASAKQMASALMAVDKAALAVSSQIRNAEARLADFQNRASKTRSKDFLGVSTSDVLTAGALYGAGRTVEAAVDKTREAENANRALTASATEAGKSYSALATETLAFAKTANLSNVEAEKSIGTLQRLLTLAGKGDELEKFSKGFLDVAAARGVNIKELDTLFQGIISGTDDALNRFGKQDPSKLAEIYAKSIGKTTEQLTEQEKILSRLKAFEPDFELFKGQNADKLGSVSGQADAAAKSIDDLKTGFSQALTQSLEFQDGLKSLNAVLQQIAGYDPIQIRIQLQAGKSPKELAEEIAGSDFNKTLDGLKAGANALPASLLYLYDLATEGVETANQRFKFATSPQELQNQRVAGLTDQFSKEKAILDKQNIDAANKKLADALKAANAEAFPSADPKAAVKDFNLQIKEADDNLVKLRKILNEVRSSVSLPLETKRGLIDTLEDKIESAIKKIRQARDAFDGFKASAISAVSGSPLAKELYDISRAAQEAYEKVKPLGEANANAAASYVRLAGAVRLSKDALDAQLQAIDYRQQARLAALTPADEMNGTPRKLETLEKAVGLISRSVGFLTQAALAKNLANNPNYQQSELEAIKQQLNTYFSSGYQFDAVANQFGNLGIGGQAILAQAKLSALPSLQDLSKLAASDSRSSSDARRALRQAQYLNQTLAENAQNELKKTLAKSQVIQNTAIPFALEKLNALQNAKGVNRSAMLDQFLAITGELGSETTPDLMQARINALNEKARIEDERWRSITETLTDWRKNGIRVLGATTRLEVRSKDLDVSTQQNPERATSGDTQQAMGGNTYWGGDKNGWY